MIAEHVRRGHVVHIVFVTDGAASHPNSRLWSRLRLAAEREAEAEEALRRLGAQNEPRSFLGLPDAAMPSRGSEAYAAAANVMATILAGLRPGVVVVPWRRDPHCDHRASWQLAMDALTAWGESPEVLEYAIWLDELGGQDDKPRSDEMESVWLPVSSELKRTALLAHRSQLGDLIRDDPTGFVLSPGTIARLTGPKEVYWRQCNAQ